MLNLGSKGSNLNLSVMNKSLLSLLTFVLAAFLSASFVSCGNDDENDSGVHGEDLVSQLQGKWEFHSGTETIMGMTITMDKSSLEEFKSMIGSDFQIWDETLEFRGYKVNGVDYSLENNRLLFESMDTFDGFIVTIKSVTSSTLILHEVISVEGIDIVADMEYRKK